MVIFHGYVSHNQMVISYEIPLDPIKPPRKPGLVDQAGYLPRHRDISTESEAPHICSWITRMLRASPMQRPGAVGWTQPGMFFGHVSGDTWWISPGWTELICWKMLRILRLSGCWYFDMKVLLKNLLNEIRKACDGCCFWIVLRILTTQKERAQHGSILKLRKKRVDTSPLHVGILLGIRCH